MQGQSAQDYRDAEYVERVLRAERERLSTATGEQRERLTQLLVSWDHLRESPEPLPREVWTFARDALALASDALGGNGSRVRYREGVRR